MHLALVARNAANLAATVLARHLANTDAPLGTLPGCVDPADAAEAEIAAALGVTVTTAGGEDTASPTVTAGRIPHEPQDAAPSPAWGRKDDLV